MVTARGPHKVERVTITFVPTSDEQSFRHIPSTFRPATRTYAWQRVEQMEYLIIPKKITNSEIVVDLFFDPIRRGKAGQASLQKVVHGFIKAKIQSEWHGLKLANVSRVTMANPPEQRFQRGTIEEILGARLDGGEG